MIYIALGSSIGNAEEIFLSAEKFLFQHGIRVLKKSKNYQFPPWGGVAKNEFTNAVWQVDTEEKSPHKFLKILNECENAHGRIRNVKNEDRTLDLDILMFNHMKIDEPDLKIPHPQMNNRDFVMIPLSEIVNKQELFFFNL